MKYFKFVFTLIFMRVLAKWVVSALASFSFSSEKVPVGKTFIYEKSNLDQTNLGLIAVHYKPNHMIESFKWHEGHHQATKVRAEINSDTLNVHRFEGLRVVADGTESTTAVLNTLSAGMFELKAGDLKQAFSLGETVWHSYDFDFASLGFAFRFIDKNKEPIEFDIYDLDITQNPPIFMNYGRVQLIFQTVETYCGVQSLKYAIDGAGLDHRGGNIWFSETEGDLVGFEIEKPDEPGYESGKLALVDVKMLSENEWVQFQKNALNSSN